MSSPKPFASASPRTTPNENNARVAQMKDAGRTREMNDAVQTAFFAHNELVDNAVSMLHRLLVPRHVIIHPPPLAPLGLTNDIENDNGGIYCTCRLLAPPLCPRTTPKMTRRQRIPHMLPLSPLFAHDQARRADWLCSASPTSSTMTTTATSSTSSKLMLTSHIPHVDNNDDSHTTYIVNNAGPRHPPLGI